jgi:hypothetical protein
MRVAVLFVACLAVSGCDNKKKVVPTSSSAPGSPTAVGKPNPGPGSPMEAALAGGIWTGKLDQSIMQISFTPSKAGLTGEIRYYMFGAVRSRDKVLVSVDDKGMVHLKPNATNNVLVGGKGTGLDELTGTLSADKATLSGTVPVTGGAGTAPWSVSTATHLGDIDPPIDLAAAEKQLLAGKWEGKFGARPAKLVVTKKAGKLSAKMMVDRAASTFVVEIDATGHLAMTSTPRPTQQGMLTETGRGYFQNRELKKLRGSIESSVKQGFIEQSGSQAFQFEDLKPAGKK